MTEQTTSTTNAQQTVVETPRPKRRWVRIGFVLLLMFGIFGWFAPTIVATTGLRNQIAKLLLPRFGGIIEFGPTSMGWFSPVVVKNLRVLDFEGKTLIDVPQFSTTNTLWRLLMNKDQLGSFNLVDLVAHVELRNPGSNFDQVIASLKKAPSDPSKGPAGGNSPRPKAEQSFVLDISNGTVQIQQVNPERNTTIKPVHLRFSVEGGSVNELEVGAGDIKLEAQVEDNVCRFAPVDLPLYDGKLHLTPTVYLDREPYTLTLPKEKVLDQVNLTPELCHDWIRFAAPILADVTQVEGKMSLDLQQATFPLSAPATGSANGVLSIHRAQAKPGPLALQLFDVIDQLRSTLNRFQGGPLNRDQIWIDMSDQQVPVKLEQGRLHHEGMTFQIMNVAVKTSGSVGMDNTLDLLAEIPIKDEWLGNIKVLTGLRGKSIQVAITGTVSNPKIDPQALRNLLRDLGGSAIEGLLQDKVDSGVNDVINKGLDKLLRKKK